VNAEQSRGDQIFPMANDKVLLERQFHIDIEGTSRRIKAVAVFVSQPFPNFWLRNACIRRRQRKASRVRFRYLRQVSQTRSVGFGAVFYRVDIRILNAVKAQRPIYGHRCNRILFDCSGSELWTAKASIFPDIERRRGLPRWPQSAKKGGSKRARRTPSPTTFRAAFIAPSKGWTIASAFAASRPAIMEKSAIQNLFSNSQMVLTVEMIRVSSMCNAASVGMRAKIRKENLRLFNPR
jgi:hypothetical protein